MCHVSNMADFWHRAGSRYAINHLHRPAGIEKNATNYVAHDGKQPISRLRCIPAGYGSAKSSRLFCGREAHLCQILH